MTANTYYADIGGNTDVTVTAGQHSLRCEFTWNDTIQELYDDTMRRVQGLRDSDPLVGPSGIVRGYDWLDYYVNTVPTIADVESWLEEQTVLPQSIRKLDAVVTQVQSLMSLKELATEIQEMIDDYADRLYWQCTVTDENDDVTVADVVLGGVFRNQSTDYGFAFRSEKATIGKDDLDAVQLFIEVYDE